MEQKAKMRIIAGPCQHESLEQSLEIATSDGPNMLYLKDFEKVVSDIVQISNVIY